MNTLVAAAVIIMAEGILCDRPPGTVNSEPPGLPLGLSKAAKIIPGLGRIRYLVVSDAQCHSTWGSSNRERQKGLDGLNVDYAAGTTLPRRCAGIANS
jgi:hypothetical protein